MTARIMDLPLGPWLIGLAAVGLLAYAGTEVVSAAMSKGQKSIDWSPVSPDLRAPLLAVSRFGVGARGVIIGAVGFFLLRAALSQDPAEAHGTRGSMIELVGMFQSRAVLTVMALGLLAYAADQALCARCQRIRPPIG